MKHLFSGAVLNHEFYWLHAVADSFKETTVNALESKIASFGTPSEITECILMLASTRGQVNLQIMKEKENTSIP
jgi:hypothetical protein